MKIRNSLMVLVSLFTLGSIVPADGYAASRHASAKKSSASATTAAKAVKSNVKSARAESTRKVAATRKERRSAAYASPTVLRTSFASVSDNDQEGNPLLQSAAFMVADQATGNVLLEKNSDAVLPIASITKLMTAMVVLDARLNLTEVLTVGQDDVDTLRGSSSHVPVGTELAREDMLRLALMSSENRAASALARHYPGGLHAFVVAMNRKAASLGLRDTRFSDSTGLNSANVSSARDLVKMVSAASRYPLIREFSTTANYVVSLNGRPRQFNNTNALVSSPDWQIGVSKTGFINESGKCLVMQAWLLNKPMIIVLLDSLGRYTRVADAQRVKRWLESAAMQQKVAGGGRGSAT